MKKVSSLVNEGFACLGMINEARSKCLLLKQRIKKAQEGAFSTDIKLRIKKEYEQIKKDLAKYTHRLEEIYDKLGNYDFTTYME